MHRARAVRTSVACLALVVCAQPLFAQDGWSSRARVTLTAAAQIDSPGLSQSTTLIKQVEETPLGAEIGRGRVLFVDGGVDVRVSGNVGVGFAVSRLTETRNADVRADIPHPFYFDARRPIAGQVSGVRHDELVLHTNLVYVFGTPHVDLAVSGGASFFRIEQDVVSDVSYVEEFPYDSASFSAAAVVRASGSKVGYNAAADVTWKVSPRWGIGGLVRFTQVRVPLDADDVDYGEHDAGGLQVGAGLRLMF